MNKAYFPLLFALLIAASCNNSNKHSDKRITSKRTGDSVSRVKTISNEFVKEANHTNDDSLKSLIGIWTLKGSENPTFEIKKATIYYPEQFKSYKYEIVKDSVKIYYDDFNESFAFGFRGKDTLTLKGDDDLSVYYRTKK